MELASVIVNKDDSRKEIFRQFQRLDRGINLNGRFAYARMFADYVGDTAEKYIKERNADENDPMENHDYLVCIKLRHDCEKSYRITTELLFDEVLLRDGVYKSSGNYTWLNDWYEGEDDVDILAITALDDIDPSLFKPYELPEPKDDDIYTHIAKSMYEWNEKNNGCMSSVIVRLKYKLRGELKIHYRNEYIDFYGSEVSFEWIQEWWKNKDVEYVELVGVMDPDDLPLNKFAKQYKDINAPTRLQEYYNLDTNNGYMHDENGESNMIARFWTILGKFAEENCSNHPALVVLWAYRVPDSKDEIWCIRKDVFAYMLSPYNFSPKRIYQYCSDDTPPQFGSIKEAHILAISTSLHIDSYDHWFVL